MLPVHPLIRSNRLPSQGQLLEDSLARPGMGLPLSDVYRSGPMPQHLVASTLSTPEARRQKLRCPNSVNRQ